MDINDSNDEIDEDIESTCKWTQEHEEVLVEWGDKAMCYGRLHFKSNQYYSYLNKWFTIPVIILSILTGVGNFAFQKYDQDVQTIAINAIGGINILSGIISTIGQSLKIAELNEAHRVSAISWDKFYRNIKVELSKHPDERIDPISMLKIYKEEHKGEYDSLGTTPKVVSPIMIMQQKKKNRKVSPTKLFEKIGNLEHHKHFYY
jgi:hypothetical protein